MFDSVKRFIDSIGKPESIVTVWIVSKTGYPTYIKQICTTEHEALEYAKLDGGSYRKVLCTVDMLKFLTEE